MAKPPYPRYVADAASGPGTPFPREAPGPSSPYGDIRAKRPAPGLGSRLSRQDMRAALHDLGQRVRWDGKFGKRPGDPSHDLPGGGIGELPWGGYTPGGGGGAVGAKLSMSPLGQALRGFLNKAEQARFDALLHQFGLEDPVFNPAAWRGSGAFGTSSEFAHQLVGDPVSAEIEKEQAKKSTQDEYWEAYGKDEQKEGDAYWEKKAKQREAQNAKTEAAIMAAAGYVMAGGIGATWGLYLSAVTQLLKFPVDGDDLYHGPGVGYGLDEYPAVHLSEADELLLWNLLITSGRLTGEWIRGGGPEDEGGGGSGGGNAADMISALLGGVSHPSEKVWGK